MVWQVKWKRWAKKVIQEGKIQCTLLHLLNWTSNWETDQFVQKHELYGQGRYLFTFRWISRRWYRFATTAGPRALAGLRAPWWTARPAQKASPFIGPDSWALQYDHLELSKSKCFLYSNQPTKVDSNTCPDFVYIYHLCFKSNLASYQSFQSPREGGVIKSEKSMLQSNQLNFGTENRKRLLRCLSQLIWIVDSLPSLLKGVLKGKKFK